MISLSAIDAQKSSPRNNARDGAGAVQGLVTQVLSQAALRPDAIAVASDKETLTYQELERYSAALCEALENLGVGPEVVVALCLPRSPALVVAALAVLRAGGAYLPMHPSDPPKRLAFLINDSGAQVLIAQPSVDLHPLAISKPLLLLDERGRILGETSARGQLDERNKPAPTRSLSDLAYVIYTSGSTGEPKGVEIPHTGLANLVQWHRQTFEVTPEDRATQLAGVGFDAAVWEVWPYLTTGASLHIPCDEILNDPERLRDWLITKAITISFVPTPLAERLLAVRWPASTALRLMLTGGDVLHRYPPPDLPFELINNYGPTECSVVTTSGHVPPNKTSGGEMQSIDSPGAPEALPAIGLPIAGTRLYILDESLKPVPPGTPGELYIGGPGVARGYRRRPELTAERFVQDPFAGAAAGQLFKTGDRVQVRPDGQIAFLGRMDQQIKIRGFRIEPDEIVAALDAHPSIAQSTVSAEELSPEERRLVAYFVTRNGAIPSLLELREFLSRRLPAYMIPAIFVQLDALPLTSSGKVNRAALPAPNGHNTLAEETSVAPGTELEIAVARILAPLLHLERVNVHANFFALGGHSLLGTQLIARLREAFGIELPLRSIFEAPTVSELAVEIDHLLQARLESMTEEEAESLLAARPALHPA